MFNRCVNIEEFEVPFLYKQDARDDETIMSLGEYVDCWSTDGDVYTIEMYRITKTLDGDYYETIEYYEIPTSLKKITITNMVYIPEHLFSPIITHRLKLETIVLPENLIKVHKYAFYYVEAEIIYPEGWEAE